MVPSATDRTASEGGLDVSMETVPTLRANSSPSIIHNLSQVMSPNQVAGSASMDTDAGVQAILQWQEVKTEQGVVERTYTQCTSEWPLASHVKLEGMESAIHFLRQACEYLHEGMMRLGSITDQKCDTGKVQQAITELMEKTQRLQALCDEGKQKAEVTASRVDEITDEVANARSRLGGLERRVCMEGQQHEGVLQELQASRDQHAVDLSVLCHNANEYQADIQARDNDTFEMKNL